MDTAVTDQGGVAVFKKNVNLTGGVFILNMGRRRYMEFLLTQDTEIEISVDTLDLLGKTIFVGSQENTIYYDFLKKKAFNDYQMIHLNQKIKSGKYSVDSVRIFKNLVALYQKQEVQNKERIVASKSGTFLAHLLKTGIIPEIPGGMRDSDKGVWMKKHFFDNVDFKDGRLAYSPVFIDLYKSYVSLFGVPDIGHVVEAVDFIIEKSKVDSVNYKWTLYFLTSTFERSAARGQDIVFVHLVEKYYKKETCWWLAEEQMRRMTDRSAILKHLFIGAECVDFKARDSSGAEIHLHQQIDKVTVLFFWNYDCKHCVQEGPVLAEWIKRHSEFKLITACVGPDVEKWKEKLREFGWPGCHLIDEEGEANFIQNYGINHTPEYFVIGKDKKIRAKYIASTKALESFLKEGK